VADIFLLGFIKAHEILDSASWLLVCGKAQGHTFSTALFSSTAYLISGG
jgi:hypothetical protein